MPLESELYTCRNLFAYFIKQIVVTREIIRAIYLIIFLNNITIYEMLNIQSYNRFDFTNHF